MVDYAVTHGLSGLLLETPIHRQLPDWALASLRASAAQVSERNFQIMEELGRVAEGFERTQIPLMVLKGASLLLTAYPNGSLRPMSDLDLLVQPHHALQAVNLLRSLGYRHGVALVRDDFFPRWYYEIEMLLPGRRSVRIDLHAHPWRPLPLAQIVRHEDFWAENVPIRVGQGRVWLPSPETLFVHLAAHAAFHNCARFIWLYDLQRVATHYNSAINWTRVVDRARRWRLSLAVQSAVAAAEQVLGPFIPPEIGTELGEIQPKWRDRLMLWHSPRDAASPLLHVACNAIGLSGLRSKLQYLFAMITPDHRHLGELYPFRHFGWPICAHLFRILRNMGRVAATVSSPLRQILQTTGVHA